ncbi:MULTISPECIES: hypothetical protein [unclassified Streptomyces]|uniref:DUF5336 domain-containing protein n=1 Tax=unclassified Streptomyces TaxID=2593676 RepID=UPI00088DA94A|nr:MULTISPECIES: hypothetical protein [unclassified Streptomyces]PBC82135.1 hypothetical protein BX261_2020 [Streptomyces sp. 2321.6]SDR51288.1 hypothetical protein SAMN05216511_5192 [Streptomyces sp. KS_16]SEC44999.1 hypothetical protein SAMN05428940_2021 [Streptomyces sp. 2133.1]SEF01445.1 hypothetical protein SAMN05428954_5253 [Streptomyces sp. 2112.3]SNC67553.1 hypothetical protein SAMN06272741_2018 [Streptomyces sp. 2114.4]
MNIRSLTRGDGVVIGAAVLLFIASFLDLSSYSGVNAWESLSLLMSVYLAGVIGAAIIVVGRALPQSQPRKVAGLDLAQFGVALTVFAAWTELWTLFSFPSVGAGLILGLISALVLAGGAVATPLVPPLQAALISAPKPQAAPYGAGPNPGYGYPGAQQQAGHGYGYPGGQQQPQPGQPYGQQVPAEATAGGQAAAAPAGAAPAAGAPTDFAPFWFAVPVARPLYGEDGSPAPIAELAPGTWYLAVEQRGQALIAQTQDGRRGVLQDTTGIQRG